MLTENSAPCPVFPYRERAIERTLRTLVEAAAALEPVRATRAWRAASLVATEADPSESLILEATGWLREELKAHGAAATACGAWN